MDQTQGMASMTSTAAARPRLRPAPAPRPAQQDKHSSAGLYAGVGLMVVGWLLTMLGIADEVSWITAAMGNDSVIGSASPGLLVFAAGLTLIWFTLPGSQRNASR
jgi:hypothetical protein